MKPTIAPIIQQRGRLIMATLMVALGLYVYHDLLFYWIGLPYTNIVQLDVDELTRTGTATFHKQRHVPATRIRSSSSRTTYYHATEYQTAEGRQIYVYEPEMNAKAGVYVYQPQEQVESLYETRIISSYTPYNAWYEIMIRVPIMVILWVMIWIIGINTMEKKSYRKWRKK